MPTRILIVDDNAIGQRVAMMMLLKYGYQEIDVADNGHEAVQACTLHEYDLVLMDCQMPKMDGLEASRQIRLLSKRQPIILGVTAHGFEDLRRDCLGSGMDGFLQKPYSIRQLLEKIKAHTDDQI